MEPQAALFRLWWNLAQSVLGQPECPHRNADQLAANRWPIYTAQMTTPHPSTLADGDELLALLTLRFSPGLGPRRIESLRQHFGSARAVLAAGLNEWRQVAGLDSKVLAGLGSPGLGARAQQELERAGKVGVTLLGRGLAGYPQGLEALGDPPAVLWVRGDALPLETVPRAISIVGTRQASAYALKWTRDLSGELARSGVNVISGLARGIDTAAHTAALAAGGVSTALLGCGVDVVYPAENARLAQQLTLVSEYPLGTRPATHHFPQRNRLIAALSAGAVIVEGDLRSGSMITATHALECGRTVFAVPGRAGDPLAAGPHRLLREGAVLTETVQDILEELGWHSAAATAAAPRPDLPPDQSSAYAAIHPEGGTLLEDIAAQARLSLPDAQMAITMLQLSGLIDEQGGRYFRR